MAIITGNNLDNLLEGTADDDIISGLDGDDTLNGLQGDDELFGGDGDDNVHGGAGNDIIYLDNGLDTLNGGAGIDTLHGSDINFAAGLIFNLGSGIASVSGESWGNFENYYNGDAVNGRETVNGTADDNVITTGGGDNTLNGGAGNDTLRGGDGDDIVNGGDGDDRIYLDNGLDTLDGGAGTDTLDGAGTDFSVATIFYLDSGIHGVVGESWSGFENYYNGDAAAGSENVYGTEGKNVIATGGGSNILYGRAGSDELYAGLGDDYLLGEAGADALYGEGGGDVLYGGTGTDSLFGGGGGDLLEGGGQADYLDGGAGIDFAIYRTANIGVEVSLLSGLAQGSHANGDVLVNIENLEGSAFSDVLTGDNGDNIIFGGDGSDNLGGAGGDDEIYGGGGNDIIRGGTGGDYLDGGDGIDTVRYNGSTEGVVISLLNEFATGGQAEGDTILNVEKIVGSNYNDGFQSGDGDNRIWGLAGDDVLIHSIANEGVDDKFWGGSGADYFTLGVAYLAGRLNIMDFEDDIDILNVRDNFLYTTLEAVLADMTQIGDHVRLDVNGMGIYKVIIRDITIAELADDIIFEA